MSQSDQLTYWEAFLKAPDGSFRGSTGTRVCHVCDERVMLKNPTQVRSQRTHGIGHRHDCAALRWWINGLDADPPIFRPAPSTPGGGGGEPITYSFDSTTEWTFDSTTAPTFDAVPA